MASITQVITGSYTAAPGSGSKLLTLPPGQYFLFAIQEVLTSADAGLITFPIQHPDSDPWTGVNSAHLEWDSAATGDVIVNYWLVTTDAPVSQLPYGGI